MYFKLREPKLNLILNGEVTQTSTFNEAFKPLQDFPSQEKLSSSENQAWSMNFQPWFGSVVVCYLAYHVDGHYLRQRTRGLEESVDLCSFSIGAREKSQHMNSFLWIFAEIASEALEDVIEEEEAAVACNKAKKCEEKFILYVNIIM